LADFDITQHETELRDKTSTRSLWQSLFDCSIILLVIQVTTSVLFTFSKYGLQVAIEIQIKVLSCTCQ